MRAKLQYTGQCVFVLVCVCVGGGGVVGGGGGVCCYSLGVREGVCVGNVACGVFGGWQVFVYMGVPYLCKEK